MYVPTARSPPTSKAPGNEPRAPSSGGMTFFSVTLGLSWTPHPLRLPDVEQPGRADRPLVDEPHPVVAAHVADVALAGPDGGVLGLAVGRRGRPGRLELGGGKIPGLGRPRDEILRHLRYVV